MTAFLASLSSCPRDFWLAFRFLTRLPGPSAGPAGSGALGPALRLAPLVGLVVGVCGALVAWLALGGLGLPPWPAALLTVGATVWITGALHEDGLADLADGCGGAFERSRKLAIMRDSRIGAYGVLALILSIGLRGAALAALAAPAGPETAAAVLIAAHSLSRGFLAPVMLVLAPARDDGLAAAAGRPGLTDALTAVALALALAALAVGLGLALGFALAALAAAAVTAAIAARQVGGYTGDVLGAVQQTAETAALLAAAALLT
jgi:adenosylcobinamide-GDP ribazoletransferase